jgi:hypothetical protein
MSILHDQVSEKLQNMACGLQLNSRPLATLTPTLSFSSLTSTVNLHFQSILLIFSYHFFNNLLVCFLLHMAFQYDFM